MLVGGAGGGLCRSADGGRTWRSLGSGPRSAWADALVAGGEVWMAGGGGTLLRADAAGAAWDPADRRGRSGPERRRPRRRARLGGRRRRHGRHQRGRRLHLDDAAGPDRRGPDGRGGADESDGGRRRQGGDAAREHRRRGQLAAVRRHHRRPPLPRVRGRHARVGRRRRDVRRDARRGVPHARRRPDVGRGGPARVGTGPRPVLRGRAHRLGGRRGLGHRRRPAAGRHPRDRRRRGDLDPSGDHGDRAPRR